MVWFYMVSLPLKTDFYSLNRLNTHTRVHNLELFIHAFLKEHVCSISPYSAHHFRVTRLFLTKEDRLLGTSIFSVNLPNQRLTKISSSRAYGTHRAGNSRQFGIPQRRVLQGVGVGVPEVLSMSFCRLVHVLGGGL